MEDVVEFERTCRGLPVANEPLECLAFLIARVDEDDPARKCDLFRGDAARAMRAVDPFEPKDVDFLCRTFML